MNYFEHHIGDYDKSTSHLSACEDGIYHRMLRRYYDKERPLPADVNDVMRLVRARVPAEKKAVDAVLAEFFHLEDDGWHHDVCDAAIADYLAGEPEREAKKANETNRLKKHRKERSELFKIITDAGEHTSWNTPTQELRAMAKRLSATAPATPATAPETAGIAAPETPPETQPATAPATPATATQAPIPTPHTPTTNVLIPPLPPTGGRQRSRQAVDEPEGFVRFWAIWPAGKRKEARGKCVEAWVRHGYEAAADAIVQHVEAKLDRTDWAHDGGQYVEAPLVYLNQRRWEGADIAAVPRRERGLVL